MSILENLFGPGLVGREPGYEVPMWSWRDPDGVVWQICRVVSNNQALAVNTDFDLQWARNAFIDGSLFRLDLIQPSGARQPYSVVGIDQRDDSGRNAINMFDRGRRATGAYDARPRVTGTELDVWSTFLFDYLGLDPAIVTSSVRGRWMMPYVPDVTELLRTESEWYRPYLMPADPMEVLRDTWREGQSEECRKLLGWVRQLGNALGLDHHEPNKRMIRMRDGWVELDLYWDLNPTPETLTEHPDQLVFQARIGPVHSSWQLAPMAAIQGLGILVDDAERVEDWIDAHLIEGARETIPEETFEAYLLLGAKKVPPLMRPIHLMEFLKAQGTRLPWEKA